MVRGGGVGAGARCHTHPEHVPLVNTMELQLRFLSPSDIDQVKCLCRDWFPIDYPDTWYTEITSNPRFFSLAATLSGSIIGLIVAETKDLSQLAKEDQSLLANCFLSNTKVGYILSLGVCQTYRKQGIASLLLDQLISYLNTNYCHQVKALYLHVLTTNTQAIHFYEHRLVDIFPYHHLTINNILMQRIPSALVPPLLLRHQGQEEGWLHPRPLSQRRPRHLGLPGLCQAGRTHSLLAFPSQV